MVASPHRAGFTLFEICLALVIGLLIIVLAVPSISGLLAEQRLRESFVRFDRLASMAGMESVTGQRECRLVWEREGIVLNRGTKVAAGDDSTNESAQERLVFRKGENFRLRRSAALKKNAPDEWTFWRNGTCEPVEISFTGADGSWVVKYDPLTGRGTFLSSEVP